MKYKRQLTFVSVGSLLGVAVGLFFASPRSVGLCSQYDYKCSAVIGEGVGVPLMLFGVCILFLSLLLRFLNEKIFRTWSRFALIYLPIAALLLYLTPVQCDAPLGLCTDRELVTWWLAGLFVIVSLIIIIVKLVRLRKRAL
jgi:hypothetical protein